MTKKDILVVRKFLAGYEPVDEEDFSALVAALRVSPQRDVQDLKNVPRDSLPLNLKCLGGRKRKLPVGSPSWASAKWDWNAGDSGTLTCLDVPEDWVDESIAQHGWVTKVGEAVVLYAYSFSWTSESPNGWGSVHNEQNTWVEDPLVFGDIVARYLLGPRRRKTEDVKPLATLLESFFREHPTFRESHTAEEVIPPND